MNKVQKATKFAVAFTIAAADHLFCANPAPVSAQFGLAAADVIESELRSAKTNKIRKINI